MTVKKLSDTLPLIALFAAATMPNFLLAADNDSEKPAEPINISVSTADELRAALTNDKNKDATIRITPAELVVKTNPPPPASIENDKIPRPIYVAASGTTLVGNSVSETVLKSDGNGDLLSVGNRSIALKSLTISGSGDALEKADGRAVSVAGSTISLEGGVAFKDRFFSAAETTSFGAAGGAIFSALISDVILAKGENGEISFSNITTFGNTFSKKNDDDSTSTTSFDAIGGAIHLAGAMRVSGGKNANAATFSGNSAKSLDGNAFGGAIFVTNQSYTSDDSPGSAYDPADEKFGDNFGFIAESGKISFSKNSAKGANVFGGAIAVAGGALLNNGAEIFVRENSAEGTGRTVAGGGISLLSGAMMKLAAGTTLALEKNSAKGTGEFASVTGGAIYADNSTISVETGLAFSQNSAEATGDGATAAGGAFAIAGDDSAVKISGKAGDNFSFSNNSVKVSGAIKNESVPNGDLAPIIKTRTPNAAGGALAIASGTLEFSSGGKLAFAQNSASASGEKTLATGGAIFISGEKTKAEFSVARAVEFSGNSATLSGTDGTARGGAIFVEDGETTFKFSGTGAANAANFSANKAVAKDGGKAEGGAIAIAGGATKIEVAGTLAFSENSATTEVATTPKNVFAQGGAIAQSAGTLEIKSTGSETISLKNNSVKTFAQNTGTTGTARGGAISVSGGTQTFSAKTTTDFSQNIAHAQSADAGSLASGGAIAILRGAQLSFSGKTVFSKNNALADAIKTAGANGAITAAQGGAIFSSGTLTLANVQFSQNLAETRISEDSQNSGTAQGGAIYQASGTISTGAASFKNNSAIQGIYDFESQARVELKYSAQGGAIYQASGTISTGALALEDNFAKSGDALGGAIYSAGTIRAEAADDGIFSIKYNRADAETLAAGGAIYKKGGSLTLTGGKQIEISENVASANDGIATGGFLHASGGATKILGSAENPATISQNSATANNGKAFGGAAYLAGGTHEFYNVKFSENRAIANELAEGGAIYIDASTALSTTLVLGGNTEISGNFTSAGSDANEEKSGITIGNGNAAADAKSLGNAEIRIDAGAKIVVSKDEDGVETRTYENVETVKISDPTKVNLTGSEAGFKIVKTASGGNFSWGGTNEINVESGNFSLSFGEGETTLENDFSITGTVAKTLELGTHAKLFAKGELPAFETMKIASGAAAEISGKMTLANSKVENDGSFTLANGADVAVSGTNSISGLLQTNGAVALSGTLADKKAPTLSAPAILVSAGENGAGASISFNYANAGADGAGTFDISAETIAFADSGTITLGAGTKLFVKNIAATDEENELECKFDGAGTIVFLDSTKTRDGDDDAGEGGEDGEEGGDDSEPPAQTEIVFSSYYDRETKTYKPSNFTIASGIKIESGILISPETTLELGAGSGLAYKRVVVNGGTLLAGNSSLANPLELYDLIVGDGGATLGKAGEYQVIKLVVDPDATTEDENGETVPATEPNKISTNKKIEITDTTTLIAEVVLGHASNAELAGAGTLRGNASGNGTISIAKIDGGVDVATGKRLRFSAETAVSGAITNSGTLFFSKDANVSASYLENKRQMTVEGDSLFKGDIKNMGTLTISGVLKLVSGSTFTQTAAGKTDLSGAGAIDFNAISENAGAISLAGTIVLDTSSLGVSTPLDCLSGLRENALDGVKFLDSSSQDLTNRVKWDDARGEYIFLGLHGTELRKTLFGDITRENIFRTYDFMRGAMLHAVAGSIRPPIFGENRATSKYMQGYLERKARERGETISFESAENAPGDFSKQLDKIMRNVWAQSQYSSTSMSKDAGHPGYDVSGFGMMLGASTPIDETLEAGAVLGFVSDKMKTSGAETSHKIDTDSFEFMAFARSVDEMFDWTLGVAGIFSSHDSKRDGHKASADSWQFGLLTEIGWTFRPQQWFEVRPYLGVQIAHSRTGSFDEGAGKNALDVGSFDGTGMRTSLGMGFAFLLSDNVQLTTRGAWLLDAGAKTYGCDGYDASGDIEYSLRSRAGERSAFEFGAYLNWRLTRSVSLYGGYTGAFRSGNDELRANAGVQISF